MFAISRSPLACHFCYFYLMVFPLNAVRKEFLFLRMSTKHFINPMFHFCALLDVVVSQMLIFPKILEQCFNLSSSHIPFYLESVFLSGPW